ncbi:MAG TPA: hypothetical protein VEI97_11445, partial [bacterium]|nr:hypothetical protein [bacterium]
MRPTALGFLLPLLLLPAPAHAADYPLPTEQELGHAIEAVHGPCGHVDGPWRLSNLLLALVPWDATYEFTAPLVECNDTEPRPLSANGRLFEWLAIYADDPQRALEYAQITDTSHREPAAVR